MGSSFTRFYGTEVPRLLNNLEYENKHVLDLGAGDGEILYGLYRKLIKSTMVTAVEISRDRCNNIERELPEVDVKCEDATNTGLYSDWFNIIICNQVIEHVEEEGKLIKEIYRLLDKGGVCFLSTVYKERFNFGYYWNKNKERVIDPTHVREYTDISLLVKLRNMFSKVYSHKIPVWFSITDFILPRLGIQGHIYETNWLLRMLRNIRLPVFGYYTWELLLWKE